MTEDELEQSRYLLTVLNDKRFSSVVQQLLDENGRDWASCQDPAVREKLWFEQKALTDLVTRMEVIAQRPRYEEKKANLRNKTE